VSQQEPSEVPPIVHEVLRSPGQPLNKATRDFFEPRFGHDFSEVRVHTDSRAAESARAVNALAYTVGRHIVFGMGQHLPATSAGHELMAHELTHVVQQSNTSVLQPRSVSVIDGPAEQEASRNATVLGEASMMSGVINPMPSLHRQVVPPGGAPGVAPQYRDCTQAITGIADANQQLESSRQRARNFVSSAISRLNNAPAASTPYETALQRHFIAPTAADRATIQGSYRQIFAALTVNNFICNSGAICGTEQAFWLPDDDLLHVCRPFWTQGLTCRAIILIHESAHDAGIDAAPGGHAPNRGSADYPTGNVAAPAGQTTAGRMNNPDAYAFFAAHVWRSTDTGSTCF
jgi:hypothetical protein